MDTMAGYTKLFNSILASTIWREEKETKILWITMLAMADKDGMVEASIPGLADMARLTVKETQSALATLESPDEFSRTKDHEGRRIEPVLGGWLVLNHAKYRQKMNEDERREYLRLKKQESRDRQRQQSVNDCPEPSTMSTQADAEEEAEAKAKGNTEEEAILNEWKRTPFPSIRAITGGRQRTLKTRLKEEFFRANWKEGLRRAVNSPFLTGSNDRKWVMDVDFFLRPDSLAKILEGKYDGRPEAPSQTSSFQL